MTAILGINHSGYDTSAALIKDGEILAAVTEERLNRQKKSKAFPIRSIQECLRLAQLRFEDIDVVTTGWNPSIHLKKLFTNYSNSMRFRPEYLFSVPNYLIQLHPDNDSSNNTITSMTLFEDHEIHIKYINHHLAHAASAFYLSPFTKSAIFSIDGFGEEETIFYGMGEGTRITPIKSILSPHSLGIFYLTITDFLGFVPNSDEWKVMGASSYGDPLIYYDTIRQLVHYDENGNFELDLGYFDYFLFDRPTAFSRKLIDLLGEPRERNGSTMTQRHYDIAAATQKITEEVIFALLRYLYQATQCEHVVVAGGVAMNSLANGKILANSPYSNLFIPPFPDDNGVSVGSALYYYHHVLDNPVARPFVTNYLGAEYSNDFIQSELTKYKVKYVYTKSPTKAAAQLIAEGKIIGWFQGKMEFGHRALGNRSILADPRRADMKDRVNNAIKFREPFRPFAPSILIEHYHEYFEDATPTPFMEKVFVIKKEKRPLVPAVTHVDGTGRLQTVSKDQNPLYWDLINEVYILTDIPLVLNTSFNLKGEPIVGTPKDALRTFYTCGLDALIMGNYLIEK